MAKNRIIIIPPSPDLGKPAEEIRRNAIASAEAADRLKLEKTAAAERKRLEQIASAQLNVALALGGAAVVVVDRALGAVHDSAMRVSVPYAQASAALTNAFDDLALGVLSSRVVREGLEAARDLALHAGSRAGGLGNALERAAGYYRAGAILLEIGGQAAKDLATLAKLVSHRLTEAINNAFIDTAQAAIRRLVEAAQIFESAAKDLGRPVDLSGTRRALKLYVSALDAKREYLELIPPKVEASAEDLYARLTDALVAVNKASEGRDGAGTTTRETVERSLWQIIEDAARDFAANPLIRNLGEDMAKILQRPEATMSATAARLAESMAATSNHLALMGDSNAPVMAAASSMATAYGYVAGHVEQISGSNSTAARLLHRANMIVIAAIASVESAIQLARAISLVANPATAAQATLHFISSGMYAATAALALGAPSASASVRAAQRPAVRSEPTAGRVVYNLRCDDDVLIEDQEWLVEQVIVPLLARGRIAPPDGKRYDYSGRRGAGRLTPTQVKEIGLQMFREHGNDAAGSMSDDQLDIIIEQLGGYLTDTFGLGSFGDLGKSLAKGFAKFGDKIKDLF